MKLFIFGMEKKDFLRKRKKGKEEKKEKRENSTRRTWNFQRIQLSIFSLWFIGWYKQKCNLDSFTKSSIMLYFIPIKF